MYCKGLTKQELLDYGFVNVIKEDGEWKIYRNWYKTSQKEKTLGIVAITMATRKHKYRPDKIYPKINFSVRNKGIFSIPLSRFLYVWFIADITEPGYVVDHIDDDPYNNDLDNLQLLSIQDNLDKRFTDNPEAWTNQWGKPKGYNK